jgi:hypothetical protein
MQKVDVCGSQDRLKELLFFYTEEKTRRSEMHECRKNFLSFLSFCMCGMMLAGWSCFFLMCMICIRRFDPSSSKKFIIIKL